MLTRIVTQPLNEQHGIEKTALDSIFSLFPTTREILKKYGSGCINFAKIAIVVLNQKVRPFTAKWHKVSAENGFEKEDVRLLFRKELEELRIEMKKYMPCFIIIFILFLMIVDYFTNFFTLALLWKFYIMIGFGYGIISAIMSSILNVFKLEIVEKGEKS